MKLKILALVLVSAASFALAADAPTLTGKWQVHSSIGGIDSDLTCTFSQKELDLTGTCLGDDARTVEIAGKVEGAKVAWSFKSEYNGAPLTVSYEGKLEGGTMSGTVTVPEYSVSGSFTASPAK